MANLPQNEIHQQFKVGLETLINQPITSWDSIVHKFQQRNLAPLDHWIKAGDYCPELCYILSGLIRIYYIDIDGNEVNQHFYQAGELISPLSSIINDEPCQYYIQALEPTQIMLANTDDLYASQENNPEWLRLEIKFLQAVFVKMARREAQLLLGNAEQRYKWFCKHYANLEQKLPQYHIASFLGITPVSLSRIRKKLKEK